MRANLLIAGLEGTLAAELAGALSALGHSVTTEDSLPPVECLNAIDRTAADAVFCTSDAGMYEELLALLRKYGRTVPVVVVSRLAEVDNWLDALDAGAHDYCAAPFEPRLLKNILDHALSAPRQVPVAV